MEPSKSIGPTTSLVFLGILIDSEKCELWLPQDKLSQLQATVVQWRGRKAGSKQGTAFTNRFIILRVQSDITAQIIVKREIGY